MPNKELLEECSLYQKYKTDVPEFLNYFEKPSIHMFCENCNSDQTFKMANNYYGGSQQYIHDSAGQILELDYICVGCEKFHRGFLVKVSDNLDYYMKAGQYPPNDISIDKGITKALGIYTDLFRKGLVCEAQGYGIGAYAYYRRILESIIDELLDDISEIIDPRDKEKYSSALEQTKKTHQTSEKIAFVKDLLPASLTAGGLNPLGTLYEILSEGMHNKPDNECLDIAQEIKTILVYLIKQIIITKEENEEYAESMKYILKKRENKSSD